MDLVIVHGRLLKVITYYINYKLSIIHNPETS